MSSLSFNLGQYHYPSKQSAQHFSHNTSYHSHHTTPTFIIFLIFWAERCSTGLIHRHIFLSSLSSLTFSYYSKSSRNLAIQCPRELLWLGRCSCFYWVWYSYASLSAPPGGRLSHYSLCKAACKASCIALNSTSSAIFVKTYLIKKKEQEKFALQICPPFFPKISGYSNNWTERLFVIMT